MRSTVLFCLATMLLSACIQALHPYQKLPPGAWRGQLILDPSQLPIRSMDELKKSKMSRITNVDDIIPGVLPFNLEFRYAGDSLICEISNGEEKISCSSIAFGLDKSTGKDTIQIQFPEYHSELRAITVAGIMQGDWIVHSKKEYSIPFIARHGKDFRFTPLQEKSPWQISGTWQTVFDVDSNASDAIGEFQQNGNHITGTFRTETGDYRYLEGNVLADHLYFSAFDGAHAFLLEGKKIHPDTIEGIFYSGKHYRTTWKAYRTNNPKLKDLNAITEVYHPEKPFDFAFPDLNHQIIRLSDEKYRNQVKIVQIMGTWCPNCKDESLFLSKYLSLNKNKPLAVFGLAFERYESNEVAINQLLTYKKYLQLDYPLLLAGRTGKENVSKALPELKNFLAFPTMLIIDKKNRIRQIHTGFDGPATSKYKKFETEFNTFVQELLLE